MGSGDAEIVAKGAGRRTGRRLRHLRRPAHARQGALGQAAFHHARLSRGAGAAGYRRGAGRHARPLAFEDLHRRHERRQGCLLRKAHGAAGRRRARRGGDAEEDRPHHAGGQPAREFHRLQEGAGTAAGGRHRRAEHGGSVVGPQRRHRRVAVFHPAGCHAREYRLEHLPGPRAEGTVRAGAPVPLAQLSRLRHRAWPATSSYTCSAACIS